MIDYCEPSATVSCDRCGEDREIEFTVLATGYTMSFGVDIDNNTPELEGWNIEGDSCLCPVCNEEVEACLNSRE